MSTQHTPEQWKVSRSIYRDDPRPFSVYRHAPTYEVLRDKSGRERRFASEAAARAAIAKIAGEQHG